MNDNKEISKSSQDIFGRLLSIWRNREVLRHIIPPFLDIGCGDNRLASRNEGGIGIDVINYGKADIIVQDFRTLPFKPDTFKTITIVGSLNYFESPEVTILECERILIKSGMLIITMLEPKIGKYWHSIREPWARYPGFTFDQLVQLTKTTKLQLFNRSKFMFGLNNLYIFRKL